MQVVSVIPVKPLGQAKSRLAPYLEDAQRRRLVTAMLRRVIVAAQEAGTEVWVLGADDSAHEIAQEAGAGWRREAGGNINESLQLVFDEAWSIGTAPLFLPGDLTFLQAGELTGLTSIIAPSPLVEAVLEPRDDSKIVLAPARKGGGTNAILIPRRISFRLQLGPDSLSRHIAEARRLGLEPSIFDSPGLARDLDTWKDLQEYEAQEPGFLARLTRESE